MLDKASGELVERSTFYAYGAAESDYRPGRWGGFREDYRFTGKEEDVEVGLVYFGKRFLNPLLGRWVSPDPLTIHGRGEGGLNTSAYAEGQALRATDPMGLDVVGTAKLYAATLQKRIAMERRAVIGRAARMSSVICSTGTCSYGDRNAHFEKAVKGLNKQLQNPIRQYLAPAQGEREAARLVQNHPLVARFLERYQGNSGMTYALTTDEARSLGARINILRKGGEPSFPSAGFARNPSGALPRTPRGAVCPATPTRS